MSTNSNIGMRYENGQIDSIYCHWDGYPAYVGKILLEYYNDHAKVCDLIDLGDISVLKPHLNPTTEEHSFASPEQGVTVAYHRDRGKPLCVSRDCCEDEFKDQNYSYLFDVVKNRWFLSEDGGPFQELWTIVNV